MIHKSLALQGSDSRDWSIRPSRRRGDADGCRYAIRFPLQFPVRYEGEAESGWGETVNISSLGALFTTDRVLRLGEQVEIYVQWPVLLDDSVHLTLIASGKIVRVKEGRAAIAFEKYEFRTCAPSLFRRLGTKPVPQGQNVIPMAHPQSRYSPVPDAVGAAEGPEGAPPGECDLPPGRPKSTRSVDREIARTAHQRKAEMDNARWERVFKEKFAVPEYYRLRLVSQSSPKCQD